MTSRTKLPKIEPYPVGTKGRTWMGGMLEPRYYPATITAVCDWTYTCDTLNAKEPMYEADVTIGGETVNGLINHCRFEPEKGGEKREEEAKF